MAEIKKFFTFLAAAGNILIVLWIFNNGVNEGFEGTIIEKISYISLMALLMLNSLLLGPGLKIKNK